MRLIQGNCLEVLPQLRVFDCLFADPPDNIGLSYNSYNDRKAERDYLDWLNQCLQLFVNCANITWISYNAKWTFQVGHMVCNLLEVHSDLEAKSCVQVYTFGQHRQTDLGNNHRPLLRLKWRHAPLYPDQIRVRSWRQEHGDKRADPRGRVPGDVFDFPRVVGNSSQRRSYHPTQLHEGLVGRCVALSTPPGGSVVDPFGGTGTTLRVCKDLNRDCTLIEIDPRYCREIVKEHNLVKESQNERRDSFRHVWTGT